MNLLLDTLDWVIVTAFLVFIILFTLFAAFGSGDDD